MNAKTHEMYTKLALTYNGLMHVVKKFPTPVKFNKLFQLEPAPITSSDAENPLEDPNAKALLDEIEWKNFFVNRAVSYGLLKLEGKNSYTIERMSIVKQITDNSDERGGQELTWLLFPEEVDKPKLFQDPYGELDNWEEPTAYNVRFNVYRGAQSILEPEEPSAGPRINPTDYDKLAKTLNSLANKVEKLSLDVRESTNDVNNVYGYLLQQVNFNRDSLTSLLHATNRKTDVNFTEESTRMLKQLVDQSEATKEISQLKIEMSNLRGIVLNAHDSVSKRLTAIEGSLFRAINMGKT